MREQKSGTFAVEDIHGTRSGIRMYLRETTTGEKISMTTSDVLALLKGAEFSGTFVKGKKGGSVVSWRRVEEVSA